MLGPIKKLFKDIVRLKRLSYKEYWRAVPFDNTYPWLSHVFLKLIGDKRIALKPMYAWGVLQAAALAKVLKLPSISVIEFGVAGGAGLLSLEAAALRVRDITGVAVRTYGFDTGQGLPKPIDYRDQPNMWFEGQLTMNRNQLEGALREACLDTDPLCETVPRFVSQVHAPIGFISFDLDLYSSTRQAFDVFLGKPESLLPRVACYFDDIYGHTYNDFCGERLAIKEFNERNEERKISAMHGLRYFLPGVGAKEPWVDAMYFAHVF